MTICRLRVVRHEREDVIVTLLRLTITGRVEETGGKYTLAVDEP